MARRELYRGLSRPADEAAHEAIPLKQGVVLDMKKPGQLLEQLKGRAWTVTAPAAGKGELTGAYPCSNVVHRDGESVLRLISHSMPHANAASAAPNMEDMYLWHLGKQTGTSRRAAHIYGVKAIS